LAHSSLGIATERISDRVLATTGRQEYADSIFEPNKSVLNAGVLFSIPAMISQGLEKMFTVYDPLPSGYYGLHHIVMTYCMMALCRIKNIEQLKKQSPGEFGKLIGLDRIPEVGHFRKKLKQILSQEKTAALQKALFAAWLKAMPEIFFYIDGHVRVYHGAKANLSKRFVSREKLCLAGTTEFWVNDQQGMPLMVITGELNEKLKEGIDLAIIEIKPTMAAPKDKHTPLFTLVIDRESYEPKWYESLWEKHQIAIITYRKNVKDKWNEECFTEYKTKLLGNNVTMQLNEQEVILNEVEFREIRKLSSSGHQTAIITTHPQLNTEDIAVKMFSRWTQENFFKYMIANFDFDKMIEYGVQKCEYKKKIPNPEYRKLTYQLSKLREKKGRLESRVYKKLKGQEHKTIECMKEQIAKSTNLLDRISQYEIQINEVIVNRSKLTSRITIDMMPEENRYNSLKKESKMFKNIIVMIAYRAETSMYNLLPQFYKGAKKEGRELLKNIFSSDADIIPDYQKKILTVVLHSLATPRDNRAAQKLCEILNTYEATFPYTDLVLCFKTVAL
jgi:hypothetical protein